MSQSTLEELLHETIRNLHTLHLFPIGNDEADYEFLLGHTIEGILHLLNYHDKLYNEVFIDVSRKYSEIGPISFLYYIDKHESSNTNNGLNNSNILQFIQSHKNLDEADKSDPESRYAFIRQLLKLLSGYNKSNEKKPVRLKESYSLVLLKFSELLEFFSKFHLQSEYKLVNYLNKCFVCELNYLSDLKTRLDSELELGYEETENIVQMLDSFIGIPSSSENRNDAGDHNVIEEKEDDSIFSYEERTTEMDHSAALNFESSDPDLLWLYKVFLQISSFKSGVSESISNYKDYIKLMVKFYKHHNGIDSIQINSFKFKELKLNFFYNFLIGDSGDSEEALLPNHFSDATKRVLAKVNIFPEIDKRNDYNMVSKSFHQLKNNNRSFESSRVSGVSHEADLIHANGHQHQSQTADTVFNSHNSSMPNDKFSYTQEESFIDVNEQPSFVSFFEYSKENQSNLILSLRHIIPLLNEFNLNFSPDFPLLFKHYMNLIYVDFPDATEQSDFEYIERVVNLVNLITEFENEDESPEEFDIKNTVFEFYEEHQHLIKENVDQSKYLITLLMKLAVYEFDFNHELKRIVVSDWNFKTLSVGQLEYNLTNLYIPSFNIRLKRRLLKTWFGKFHRFKKLERVSSDYYNKRLKVKFIKDKWIPPLIKYGDLNSVALKFTLGTFFRRWSSITLELNKKKAVAGSYSKELHLRKFLSQWTISYHRKTELDEMAAKRRESNMIEGNMNLKNLVWKFWFSKMNSSLNNQPILIPENDGFNQSTTAVFLLEIKLVPSTLSEKLVKLTYLERIFILKKFLHKWDHSFSHEVIVKEIKRKNDQALLSFFFFSLVQKKFKINYHAKSIIKSKQLETKERAFAHWKKCKELRDLADSFYFSRVSGKMFKQWKLQMVNSSVLCLSNPSRLRSMTLSSFLKKWILASKLKPLKNKSKSRLLKRKFYIWTENLIKVYDIEEEAVMLDKNNITRNQFLRWMQNYRSKGYQSEVADLNIQRKYFNHLLAMFHHYTVDYQNAALQFPEHKLTFEVKVTLASSLSKWKQAYSDRFEALAQKKILHFKKASSNPNTKYLYLSSWVKKYNDLQRKNNRLSKSCEVFAQKSKMKVTAFQKWSSRTKHLSDLNERSQDFEATLLHKKFVLIWYDQFVNKVLYLNEISDNYASEKDSIVVRDIIGKWSMKFIKKIRRNQQTCEMFIERWEVSKARSILDLWIQKTKERSDGAPIDDFTSNISLISNSSPLANKSNRSLNQENSQAIEPASYLYTPVKQQVSRSPVTPYSRYERGPSPSKLQETNMKLRSERIESLRKHFSRAKGQSTPRKAVQPLINSLDTSKVQLNQPGTKLIKLSPPKTASVNRTNVLPPKAPDFSTALRSVPSNDYMDSSASTGRSDFLSGTTTTVFGDDEESLIETAKRLRRITPIFVPSEGNNELRLSPVKKLKDRLMKALNQSDKSIFD